MEWIAHCTTCGELERAPNGPMMEAVARLHRRDTGHMTIIGYEPELTEEEKRSKRVVGGAHEVLDRISQPLDIEGLQHRPFPETYSDWVSLGVDIKEKVGIDDFETTTRVNLTLGHIDKDDELAEEAKRWLSNKAAELGLT